MQDFDKTFDRRAAGSIKWNKYSEDIIPLWVADMDFEVAEPIQEAIEKYKLSKIYGYAAPREDLAEVIVDRFKRLYGWDIKREWIVWVPSVVSSLYVTANLVSFEPYSVMTSVPVYQPFLGAAQAGRRSLNEVNLKIGEKGWEMDFEEMERKINADTKLYILCNPHNPTGRMYTSEELGKLGDFCVKNGIVICSDEIHADIILNPEKKHIPIASISEKIAMNTISLYSSAKAFNTPGLNAGFAVIPNPNLRSRFVKEKDHIVPYMGLLGSETTMAAFKDSGQWLEDVLIYLKQNHDYLFGQINSISGLKMFKSEGTYLAWIDYSGLGIDNFADFLEKNGVGVMEASIFGGSKHIRLNFATQRNLLQEAVARIKIAVANL
jgi:cystathionine beta-lyase